jgi:hypothetical protein
MTIRDCEINLVESSFLQVREDSFPGKFMFGISDTSSEDLPETVYPTPATTSRALLTYLIPSHT